MGWKVHLVGKGTEPEGDLLPTAPPEGGALNLRKDKITGNTSQRFCLLIVQISKEFVILKLVQNIMCVCDGTKDKLNLHLKSIQHQ